jgi:hypothetical protein
MGKEIKANVGTTLNEAEEKEVDPKDIGQLHAQPPKGDVQAQYHWAVQVCPYCGCVGYGYESDVRYRYFTCHCCHRTFVG